MRGKNSFDKLRNNISLAKSLGLKFREEVVFISKEITINFDSNFIDRNKITKENSACVIRDEKGGNIMVYPDKKSLSLPYLRVLT